MANPRISAIPTYDKPHTAAPHGVALRHFREVVLPYDGDDCLLWPYATTSAGYGQVSIDGKVQYVHVLVCEREHGPRPSPRHQAAHSCGNGHIACAAKRHLSWKTPKENQADRLGHGTHCRGESIWTAKLTSADVRKIRSLRGSLPKRQIAARFGVSLPTVKDIHARKTWTWVE